MGFSTNSVRLFVGAAVVCVAGLVAGPVQAASITWNGSAGDFDYSNGANWNGNRAPLSNDYADTAVFGALGTPGTISRLGPLHQYNYTGSPTKTNVELLGVNFQTAGWTLNFAMPNVSNLSSAGVGVNTFTGTINAKTNTTYNIAAGNTLFFDGGFYQRALNINLNGGGIFRVDSEIGGFGGTVGAWGMYVTNGTTLRVDAAVPHSSGSAGAAYISDLLSAIQLKTTVSAATALIGGRVRDNTGLGLSVTDIGGGYVEIRAIDPTPAVPEPASIGLFGAVAGTMLLRRRTR